MLQTIFSSSHLYLPIKTYRCQEAHPSHMLSQHRARGQMCRHDPNAVEVQPAETPVIFRRPHPAIIATFADIHLVQKTVTTTDDAVALQCAGLKACQPLLPAALM